VRHLYLVLAAVGALLPYSQLARFVAENGLDLPRAMDQLFATPISSFFGVDVIVTGVTVLVLAVHQRRSLGAGAVALCVAATLGIGPSCGLPLLLYFRGRPDGAGAPH
jgi:hypothetical protein